SFKQARHNRDIHSFPTRRSSDLPREFEADPSNPPNSSVPDRPPDAPNDELVAADAIPMQQRIEGNNELKRRSAFSRSRAAIPARSEEHTSELQSLAYLVCRLLLE